MEIAGDECLLSGGVMKGSYGPYRWFFSEDAPPALAVSSPFNTVTACPEIKTRLASSSTLTMPPRADA
jgi:hypothetical protein